ncbi:TPA: oxidoreductase, partial [Escherichia coli]
MVKIISFLSLMLLSISAYSNIGDIVIDGSIANANSDKGYVITEKQFDSFPRDTIVTTTPWTPTGKKVKFKGVDLSYVLKLAGANGA